jgi:hypothetical protein
MAERRKRVAFYLRVSTGSQNVENQRRELQEVADRAGWEVVAVSAYSSYPLPGNWMTAKTTPTSHSSKFSEMRTRHVGALPSLKSNSVTP